MEIDKAEVQVKVGAVKVVPLWSVDNVDVVVTRHDYVNINMEV